jgi:hypothetical protein
MAVKRVWVIGGGQPAFEFDSVIRESHTSELTVTENPIETGVVITDHGYMLADRLEIEAAIGDSWLGMRDPIVNVDEAGAVTAGGFDNADFPWLTQDGGGDTSTRSQRAYQSLRGLQRSMAIVGVQTGLRFYRSLIVRTLTTEQDRDSADILIFRATFSEPLFTTTETVTFPPRKAGKTARQASKKADGGEKSTKKVDNASAEYQILESRFGDSIKKFKDGLISSFNNPFGGP